MKRREWEYVRLGCYCSKIGSGSTPRGGQQVYQSEGTSLIRSQNVYNGLFTSDGLAFLGDEEAARLDGVTVKNDDVLLNITGDSVARCCYVPESVLPARVNQHVAIIRPKPNDFDAHFLMYFFISPYMQATMLSLAGSGGTRKALTKEMIQAFEMPKPPLPIQQKVAETLSVYDDLIENNARRIELLEQAARLLYEEWFVRLRFPGREHTRIVDGVPKGWERKRLGEVAELQYGKALKADSRVEGPFPVYGSSGVVGSHNAALVKGPGIIVGRKGNVGIVYCSAADFWPIDTVYFVPPERFTFYLLHNLRYQNFTSSDAAVPGLNRKYAHSLPILTPSKTLRDQFEAFVGPIYDQMVNLEQMNEKLREARDLLLPRLMSGEISV